MTDTPTPRKTWSDVFADLLSERMIFGVIILFGFYTLAFVAVVTTGLAPEARQMARDALLVVGPLLGVIVNAIWKTDKTDRQAATTAAVLAAKAPDLSGGAPAAPQPVVVTNPASDPVQTEEAKPFMERPVT